MGTTVNLSPLRGTFTECHKVCTEGGKSEWRVFGSKPRLALGFTLSTLRIGGQSIVIKLTLNELSWAGGGRWGCSDVQFLVP